MKTAEEWTKQALKYTGDLLTNANYYLTWAKQIQLDAYKAGMTEAAEITDNKVASWGIQPSIAAVTLRDEILSARDRKESL